MEKNNNELENFYEMIRNKTKHEEFKAKIDADTMKYQRKFNFELNSKEGHRTWNVEADAFKHAYGSAIMALEMGNLGSLAGGIQHEKVTPNNPKDEWNMDSWNNNQGRKIANEIKKEYGKEFYSYPKERQEAIIAAKVMYKMQKGELITHPSDKRKYNGQIEKLFYKSHATGYAAPVQNTQNTNSLSHTFTPDEIGAMTPEEFSQNEAEIMKQMQNGQIKNETPKIDYSNYKNPQTGKSIIYTREDIGNMLPDEFSQHEKAINAQMQTIGIPSKSDVPQNIQTHTSQKAATGKGKWVTIHGKHVFIEE